MLSLAGTILFCMQVLISPIPAALLPAVCAPRTAPGVCARLWLSPAELGENDRDARLWLHLDDGRVLAFRLPADRFGDDRAAALLAVAVADDARGMLLEIRDPAFGYAIPLYAAPPAPMPNLPWGHPRHEAARRFAEGLDQEVLRLLAGMEGHRAYASVRNYNRLAALAPVLRERRMQALARFPVLAAPVLLTAHHRLEHFGGKRHAWRNPDDAVTEAIDRGRDLVGALAVHFGISRGLVRSPLCGAMWGATAIPAARLLRLIDGIPAHRRPSHPEEIERVAGYLVWLNHRLDERVDPYFVGQTVFKAGWNEVWEACERHFPDLQRTLADTGDFLRAAAARAARHADARRRPPENALALAWMRARGLPSLLKASARWHAFVLLHRNQSVGPGQELISILGEHVCDRRGTAREITRRDNLVREGAQMHHCVGQYWTDCVEDGTRIFSLRLTNGERATGQYRCGLRHDDLEFRLVQLRGPCNAEPGAPMRGFAASVAAALNAPACRPARLQLMEVLLRQPNGPRPGRPQALLDPASETELAAVLDHAAASPPCPTGPGELLRAFVAGYGHHNGPAIEAHLAVGDRLTLAREPDNPYDRRAVRIDWRGEKLGYVPRARNADIARRLDAGEPLSCRIGRLNPAADPWARLEFVILDRDAEAAPRAAG